MHQFDECPDCKQPNPPLFERYEGHMEQKYPEQTDDLRVDFTNQMDYRQRMINYAMLHPTEIVYVNGQVRAYCDICGWSTSPHDTVEECADEWNATRIGE